MPKSFLYAVRDYRYGYYCGGSEQGVNVMTTRSGLSIKKVGSSTKPSTSTSQVTPKDDQRTNTMKTKQRKRHKSNSQLSFVTRYYMRPNVTRGGHSNLMIGDHFTRKYHMDKNIASTESTDDEGDGEEGTNLDGFILSASENCNNNTNCQEILEQKETWQADAGNGTKPDITNPLVKYFADNRLPDVVMAPSSEYPPEAGLLYAIPRSSNEICGDNDDNRVYIKNNIQFVVRGSNKKTDGESDDNASSASSDVFRSIDSASLVQMAPDDQDDSSNIETKLLKLRDAQLKVQFVKSTDGQKLIKCVECNRIFDALSAYIAHLRSHTKSKSTCFLCGKAFSRSWLLKGHMRTHTGERPFPCTYEGCNKSFADKSNLRSHTLIHASTKKEHKCNKCGRSFSQKRYLHKHMLEVCRVSRTPTVNPGEVTPPVLSV